MNAGQRYENSQRAITPKLLKQIEELSNTIHHGSINLTFQDGILVQIDKTEKIRIKQKTQDKN